MKAILLTKRNASPARMRARGFLLPLACWLLSLVSAAAAPDQTVKIGAVLPLSGNSAFLGEAMREMMLMAREDAPKERFNYQLIFEDNAFELKKTALAANKLIDVDRVDGIVSLFGNWGRVAGTICQKKRVPHLNVSSWEETQRIGDFNFNGTVCPADSAGLFATRALQEGIRNVAILHINSSGFNCGADRWTETLEKRGLRVVFREKFNAGERDFRTMIARLLNKKPDALIVLSLSTEGQLIFRQLRTMDKRIAFSGNIDEFEDLAPFEGCWFPAPSPAQPDIVRRFKTKTGHDLPTTVMYSYDSVRALIQAFETLGAQHGRKPTPDEVAAYLSSLRDFETVYGLKVSMRDRLLRCPPVLLKIEGGRMVPLP